MDDKKRKISKMTWSFSRLSCFETCKYEWYLNYLLTDKDGNSVYLNEQNFYAAFGELCHVILEKILKKEIQQKNGLKYFKTHFAKIGKEFDISDATVLKYQKIGEEYFKNINFDWLKNFEILGVEKECKFKISELPFRGYIDLLIRDIKTGDIRLIDHKSANYPIGKKGEILKSQKQRQLSYERQLYLYSTQVYEEFGVFPKTLEWNYFRSSQWLTVPFSRQKYNQTKKWAERVVLNIKKEDKFEPHLDFFYCENLCGYRNSCEYKEMESDLL